MKNLFLINTDKPTGLFHIPLGIDYSVIPKVRTGKYKGYHVYITNEESPKENDPCIVTPVGSSKFPKVIKFSKDNGTIYNLECKKIVLTTDPDLIKEGVQEIIDDKFFDWLITDENYKCDYVEVKDFRTIPAMQLGSPNGHVSYDIVLPNQEEALKIERIAMDSLKDKWSHLYTSGYPQRPFPSNYENDLNSVKIGIYEGRRLQAEEMFKDEAIVTFETALAYLLKKQEKMFTTEEVKNIANWAFHFYKRNDLTDDELEVEFTKLLNKKLKK